MSMEFWCKSTTLFWIVQINIPKKEEKTKKCLKICIYAKKAVILRAIVNIYE